MNTKNKHPFAQDDHLDDFSVLNYLIEHVKGLRPTSMMPEYAFDEETDVR